MHCFASETQIWYTNRDFWRWVLSLKGQENLLLKNLQLETRVENAWFLSWRTFLVGKYGIQSTNEMAFKRTVTLRASFRFPAIRFDAPTLLSFSGCKHAHAKCPSVHFNAVDCQCRKIPKISPGAYTFSKTLFEGLICGGKFAFQNRLG